MSVHNIIRLLGIRYELMITNMLRKTGILVDKSVAIISPLALDSFLSGFLVSCGMETNHCFIRFHKEYPYVCSLYLITYV